MNKESRNAISRFVAIRVKPLPCTQEKPSRVKVWSGRQEPVEYSMNFVPYDRIDELFYAVALDYARNLNWEGELRGGQVCDGGEHHFYRFPEKPEMPDNILGSVRELGNPDADPFDSELDIYRVSMSLRLNAESHTEALEQFLFATTEIGYDHLIENTTTGEVKIINNEDV